MSLFNKVSFIILLNFILSTDCLAVQTTTKINFSEIVTSVKSDTIAKTQAKIKPPKTKAHKIGKASYIMLWGSYVGFIGSFLLSFLERTAVTAFIIGLFPSLAFLLGIAGFFTAILSLLMFINTKSKKGRALPIMSILMVVFPIIGILIILFQIGKGGD